MGILVQKLRLTSFKSLLAFIVFNISLFLSGCNLVDTTIEGEFTDSSTAPSEGGESGGGSGGSGSSSAFGLSFDGVIQEIVVNSDGTRAYIGGSFNNISAETGNGVLLSTSPATGLDTLSSNFNALDRVQGTVDISISDGSGGFYIGGSFTSVGGVARTGLAHINADGSLNTSWNPVLSGVGPQVNALALSGSSLYVGGSFLNIDGQGRNHLAEFNMTTGNITSWNPNVTADGGIVNALAISGSSIYVGGSFSTIGGQTRNRLAEISLSTALASSWNPNPNNIVYALAVSGNSLYVGGAFTEESDIAGASRNSLAEIDLTTGLTTAWDPHANAFSSTYALAVSGSSLYVGGSFTSVGGQSRNRLAELDLTTGLASSWNPNANNIVFALAVSGSSLYVGGSFTSVGGQSRNRLAELDLTTGLASSWNPNANNIVSTLALSGSNIYAGGRFASIGAAQTRNNLAEIDLTTGQVTSWAPNSDRAVNALALSGSSIYAGGQFTTIGGQARNYLAELDLTTGNATSWNPNPDDLVYALAVFGSSIYAGGDFSTIGGQTRSRLAEINLTTGLATAWNPGNLNGTAKVLVVNGNSLYVGGRFTGESDIAGASRNSLAEINLTTGLATAWNPNPDPFSEIRAIVVSGSHVYVGGEFNEGSIGGQARNYLAELDLTTGNATSWNPNPNSAVYSLALSGNSLYVGGFFSTIDSQARNRLAEIDLTTGNATSWNPNASVPVNALAVSGSDIYISTSVGSMDGKSGLAFGSILNL